MSARLLQLFIGAFLLFASILKANSSTISSGSILSSESTRITVVLTEAAIGAWAVAGVYGRLCRLVLSALFACFAFVSFGLAITGKRTCGCFGPYEIHPWLIFTFARLPVLVLRSQLSAIHSLSTFRTHPLHFTF